MSDQSAPRHVHERTVDEDLRYACLSSAIAVTSLAVELDKPVDSDEVILARAEKFRAFIQTGAVAS